MEDTVFTLGQWLKDSEWRNATEVLIILVVCAVLHLVWRFIAYQLHIKAERTKNYFDDVLLTALVKPVALVFWTIGISLSLEILKAETEMPLFDVAEPLRYVGTIFAVAWFLTRFIKGFEFYYIEYTLPKRDNLDQTTVEAISKLMRLAVTITAVLTVLQTLGYSISGVLAFGGLGGLVVGFAAKDLLSNVFGGLMIYLDRPFNVGDWIRSPDRDIEGTVEKIGWRLTVIRTFDKRPLYIPNAIFTTIAVQNPSRMTNRRIYQYFGIRYTDADHISHIVSDVETMLKQHQEIDQSKMIMVNLDKYSPSAIEFFIYTFTKTTDWQTYHAIKQDVMLKVNGIIENYGAELALPSMSHYFAEPLDITPEGMEESIARSKS